jgi:ureidoacrylate peracid hydrolase
MMTREGAKCNGLACVASDLSRCLVVVIDVQNDFCSVGGALYEQGCDIENIDRMLPTLALFLEKTRQLGGKILFTRHQYQLEQFTPFVQTRERLLFGGQGFPIPGTWGEAFCSPVTPEQGDIVIDKHHYSAFSNPQLEQVLTEHGIQTLVLTGVLTNVCVETTAREADRKDLYTIVVDDCVASDSPELHRAALANIRDYFGWVTSSRDLLALWSGRSR